MDAHAVAHESLEWLRLQPPWISAGAIGAVAGLEYVVPPVPGDTVAVAGGVLVARGVLPAGVVLVAVTLGSVVGAMIAYSVGRLAGTHPKLRALMFRFVKPSAFDEAAEKYRRWGKWLIAANRFFPGVRASFLFAAGLFGIRARDVVLLSAASALAWNALLIGAGFLLGANLDDVIDLVQRYSTIAWGVLFVVIVAMVAKIVRAVRRARSHGSAVAAASDVREADARAAGGGGDAGAGGS